MTMKHSIQDQNGVVAIMTILWVSILSLAALATVTLIATAGLQMTGSSYASERTFDAAEAGLNQGLYMLANDGSKLGSFCMDFDGVPCVVGTKDKVTMTIATVPPPGDPYDRAVTAKAEDATGKARTVAMNVRTSTYAIGLDYAAQASAGGIILNNNSYIKGDAYSNGSVVPANSGDVGNIVPDDTGTFPGNITVAGVGNKIEQMTISGNAYADIILGKNGKPTTIAGTARFQSIPNGHVTAGGVACQTGVTGGTCVANAGVPVVKDLPITNTHINQWTADILNAVNDAVAHGTGQSVGATQIAGNVTWGVTKVTGDLTFANNATLTLSGPLWVTGNIVLNNNSTMTLSTNTLVNGNVLFSNGTMVRLAASVGGNDGVFIVNNNGDNSKGRITVENGVQIFGSGDSHSALTMLSTNNSVDPANPAILASNGSNAVIYYAKDGVVRVSQTGNLNAVLGNTIYLESNAIVRFRPSLQFFTIPSPTPTPIGPFGGTWREL